MSVFKNNDVIWLDGEFIPHEQAQVSVMTHTLHYGMGVFEGVRAYQAKKGTAIFRLQEHTERLFESAKIVNIKIPFSPEELNQVQLEILKKNELDSAYLRPMCFYGGGELGMNAKNLRVHVMVAAWEWASYHGEQAKNQGIKAKVSSYIRDPVYSRAKANGNYMASMLALDEAQQCGFDDAIMLDREGYVSEATVANIFVIKNNKIVTPNLTSALAGITRASVYKLAEHEGFDICEQRIIRDELYTADEIFVTGTAAEVTPIVNVDGHPVGTGVKGPITNKLAQLYFDHVHGEGKFAKQWLTYAE